MRRLAAIGLRIAIAIVVAAYILLRRDIVPLFFAISIVWFHEFGHFLLAKRLGQKPSALCVSFLILASGVFKEISDNKKHEKIVVVGGPLGGLFAYVFFGLILNQISPLPLFIWVVGLGMVLLPSTMDFTELFFLLTNRRPPTDMLNKKINILGCSWLLVFSKERWEKLKSKIEKQIGREIKFREIVLR